MDRGKYDTGTAKMYTGKNILQQHPRLSRSDLLNLLAITSLFGIGLFVLTVLLLHVFQTDLDPWNEAVSYYVHGNQGWLLTIGLLGLGVSSLAITFGIWNRVDGTGGRAGRILLCIWSIGVIVGGIFPADPPGSWSQPPSLAGMIHGNAALIAFLALPPGALLLSRSFRRQPLWKSRSGTLWMLGILSAFSLLAFAASMVPVFISPGPPTLLGLTERILLGVYTSWLGVAAVGLFKSRL